MKKILYSLTIIISLFVFTQKVDAYMCYYKDEANGLYFYTKIVSETKIPEVRTESDFLGQYDGTKHLAQDAWKIKNWTGKSGDFEQYITNSSYQCPGYLVYDQNKSGFLGIGGDDAVYFTSNKNISLEDGMYVLSSYEKKDEDFSCSYESVIKYEDSVTYEVKELPISIKVNPEKQNWVYIINNNKFHSGFGNVKYDGNVLISDPMLLITTNFFETIYMVDSEPVGSFFEFYDKYGVCPTYELEYDAPSSTVTLTPDVKELGEVDDNTTNIVDDKYEFELECPLQYQPANEDDSVNMHVVDIKFQIGKGNSVDKICAKYNTDSVYTCNVINDKVNLSEKESYNDITILFESASILEYYETNYFSQGKCPSGENEEIFVNRISPGSWYYISDDSNSTTITNPNDFTHYSSEKFKLLLGDLKTPLEVLESSALSYEIIIDGNSYRLSELDYGEGICKKGFCNEPRYQTEKALRNLKSYCNDVRKLDPTKYNETLLNDREQECASFDKLYDRLVSEGVIVTLTAGCDFISDDLRDKLNWILDIIKIAGPILAILLGMLDFIKVIASGDSDKGMKDAWKKFQIRLIAAALLFLIPLILAIPINEILGDKVEDDPFCYVGE